MFRSRSKFDNEAPMSRRGMRVGLVFTVALAMVAVLASTVGVLSSQSSTPSLTFVDASHGTFNDVPEGEIFTINYTSSASTGYTLTLDLDTVITPLAGFDFDQDIEDFKVIQDGVMETDITALPQDVFIEAGTTMIAITFKAVNDELVEPNDSFTLSTTPGSGARKTTTITLVDPIWEVNLGAAMDINEGATSSIPITLTRPVTQYLKDQRARGSEANGGYLRTVANGSNFEDISSISGAAFPVDDNNEQYDRNLGFEFEFYGTKHSDIAVHTNGFVGFTDDAKANVDEFVDTSPPGTNQGDKTPGTGIILPIVAPLLSPLAYHITDSHGMGLTPRPAFYGARLETGTVNDRYIVQYTNARAGVPAVPARVPVTFQVALFANGRIEFRYEDIPTSAQGVGKIGISKGTGTGKWNEFSYRANNFSGGAESDIRIVYTPPLKVEAVTIDSGGNQVGSSVDIIDTIAVGGSSGVVETTYADNTDWDGNRDYTVRLTHNSAAVITGAAVRYTVMDNDEPEVVLERVSGSSVEGGSVVLRARLDNAPSGGAPEELTVNLARDTASTAGTSDYDTIPATVTIPAGEQVSNSFTVMITDDTEVEFNENLIIEVTSLVYGANTVMPTSPGVVDITIISDDKITATITASDAAEGGVTTVNISLDQAFPANTPNGAVMLVLDGTDRSNDVSGLPADVTDDLRNGTAASVQVTLTDDSILEGTEVVTVKLSTASVASVLAPVSASFNINDNESGMVSVARVSSTSDYAEGATVQFEFALQPGVTTEVPITVNYELTAATVDEQGNRRAPADASDRAIVLAGGLAPGFAKGLALPVRGLAQMARSVGMETIPKNGNRVLLTIRLTDDTTAEETELLRVGLTDVSAGGSGAPVDVNDNMDETVIRILDNEDPVFEIIGSGSVNEDDGTYPVTLRRLGRLTHNGMAVNEIQFEIVGEGADGGDFRGPLIRKFTFSPGSALSNLIRLPLADDNSEESDKTFQIRVYAPGQMPGQVTPQAAPIVDSSGARFTSITLIDSDVADFFGALPATGGPVLPVWLLVVLALTGIALLVPTLRRI